MPARLHARTVADLPTRSPELRASILAGERTPEAHQRWLEALELFDCVEVCAPPGRLAEPRELRVAVWNLERCRHLTASTALLARTGADVTLLSELDAGMARSANHHTARELSAGLGHGYAYAVEFLELGLGGPEERERHAGGENRLGLHGGAITSALPIARPAVVRLDAGGAWFDGERGEPRVGTRMAVLGTVRAGGVDVALAAVHLESHSDPEHRAEQLTSLLRAVDDYAAGAPAVVAGDFNTLSLPTAWLGQPDRLRAALEADPERFVKPVSHEPLFEQARELGYRWQGANVVDEGTVRRIEAEGSRRIPVRLDWILTRGVGVSGAATCEAVDAATGQALSDHEALVVTVRPHRRAGSDPLDRRVGG